MNREIKFDVMLNNKHFGYELLSESGEWMWCVDELNPDKGIRWTFGVITGNGLIRRQYTGLKDKNGVEIYEGDIDSFGWIVCFEHGVFCIKQTINSETFIPIHETTIREVKGNIYQHPELLTNK